MFALVGSAATCSINFNAKFVDLLVNIYTNFQKQDFKSYYLSGSSENSLQFGESDEAAKYWKIGKKGRYYNIIILYKRKIGTESGGKLFQSDPLYNRAK